jgi:acetyltransferase-like isoleucine patch superfamily enzyme
MKISKSVVTASNGLVNKDEPEYVIVGGISAKSLKYKE